MNLDHLNDACLISETKRLALLEREWLDRLLQHLREIERRRLFGKNLPRRRDWLADEPPARDGAERERGANRRRRR